MSYKIIQHFVVAHTFVYLVANLFFPLGAGLGSAICQIETGASGAVKFLGYFVNAVVVCGFLGKSGRQGVGSRE